VGTGKSAVHMQCETHSLTGGLLYDRSVTYVSNTGGVKVGHLNRYDMIYLICTWGSLPLVSLEIHMGLAEIVCPIIASPPKHKIGGRVFT